MSVETPRTFCLSERAASSGNGKLLNSNWPLRENFFAVFWRIIRENAFRKKGHFGKEKVF